MRINKQLQKEFLNKIKENSCKMGFKTSSGSMYKIQDDNFLHAVYLIVSSEKLVFRIYVKKYTYDNFFWKIMHMEENLDKKDSLRAIGAFAAPSVLVGNGEIQLTENIDKLAEDFVAQVFNSTNDFLKKHDVNEYVITHVDIQDEKIVKCLAYIDKEEATEAINVARKEVEKGNSGRFQNEGKGFFELILEYLNES